MPATQSQDLDDRIPDTDGITSAAFAITQQPPHSHVWKLQACGHPSLTRFEVVCFSIAVDQAWQTAGFILSRSVSEGSRGTLPSTQKRNPSLTQRVGIVTNAELQSERVTGNAQPGAQNAL